MAYLDYPGLSYFKSLLDETYLRTSYTGDTTIAGDVTFTGDTVFSKDITGNVDGKAKKDWRGQQIDSTYIKSISTNDNVGQIVYTKGDDTSNYIMIDIMQGATASAVGKAGLVPAPTISERTKFLRGDGEWGVPTDIYVTQNLINTNDSFPILIGATAGATESQIGTAIAFGTKVSVNPNTHALIADHLILKHPTYSRNNAVTSKVMYTLNFADNNDGNGNNLSEIYGYIDKPSEGGEHELGFRLFGNPNVQGVEEIFTYLSVGLSNTNIPYGHAPKTPVPADHNEDTDIITRSYLKLNGSITGLVHTSMDETIDGYKTFLKTVTIDSGNDNAKAGLDVQGDVNIDSGDNTKSSNLYVQGNSHIHGNEDIDGNLNVDGTSTLDGNVHMLHSLDVDGTANVDGASTLHGDVHMYNNLDVDKNANIDGNETVGGTLTTTGKITGNNGLKVTGNTTTDTLTVNSNETVGGTLTVTGKITGNGGAEISGGNGLQVTGNETVSGNLTVGGTTTTDDLAVTDDATIGDDLVVEDTVTVGGQVLKKTGTNTTQEYVNYITNQEGSRTTIINNIAEHLIDPDQGLKFITKGTGANAKNYIAFKKGNGLTFHEANDSTGDKGQVDVDFNGIPPEVKRDIVTSMVDPNGAIVANATSGLLDVNFAKIDDNTKADILSALDLQYPLKSSLTITVDPKGVSTDGTPATDAYSYTENGVSKSYTFEKRRKIPFKTIQAAVNWVSSRVNLVTYNVYINVVGSGNTAKPRIYRENVTLPVLARSTGSAYIRTASGDKDVCIIPPRTNTTTAGHFSHCMAASIGSCSWHVSHFVFTYPIAETQANGQAPTCVGATADGAVIHLYGCDFHVDPAIIKKYNKKTDAENAEKTEILTSAYEATHSPLEAEEDQTIKFDSIEYITTEGNIGGNNYTVRMIHADNGGSVHIHCDSLGSNIETHLPSYNGLKYIDSTSNTVKQNASIAINPIAILRGSKVVFRRSENNTEVSDDIFKTWHAKGTFTSFIFVSSNSSTTTLGGAGVLVTFTKDPDSTVKGKMYSVESGSSIIGSGVNVPAADSQKISYNDIGSTPGSLYSGNYTFPGTMPNAVNDRIVFNSTEFTFDGENVTSEYSINANPSVDRENTFCWTSSVYPAPLVPSNNP